MEEKRMTLLGEKFPSMEVPTTHGVKITRGLWRKMVCVI